jgi:hypothetical protein
VSILENDLAMLTHGSVRDACSMAYFWLLISGVMQNAAKVAICGDKLHPRHSMLSDHRQLQIGVGTIVSSTGFASATSSKHHHDLRVPTR